MSRIDEAKKLFLDMLHIKVADGPTAFRSKVLVKFTEQFSITHSAACTLYNNAKRELILSGAVEEFGRQNLSPSNTPSPRLTRTISAGKESEFLRKLERTIREKDSWIITDSDGELIDYADCEEAAERIAAGVYQFNRLEPLEEL